MRYALTSKVIDLPQREIETIPVTNSRRMDMSSDPAINRLKFAAGLVMIFGVLVALGAHPATAWPVETLADIILWPFDGAQDFAARETRVMSGIGGGVMAGWGVMLWLVAARVYPKDPVTGRLLIVDGIVVWFVIDSAASLAAGAPLNVLFNIGFLAIFLTPLLLPAKRRETV
jgi:hypothetical protein